MNFLKKLKIFLSQSQKWNDLIFHEHSNTWEGFPSVGIFYIEAVSRNVKQKIEKDYSSGFNEPVSVTHDTRRHFGGEIVLFVFLSSIEHVIKISDGSWHHINFRSHWTQ